MMGNWTENILDRDILQDNLTFVPLFIAVYEYTTSYVVDNIRSLLCDICIEDGKEKWIETEIYKSEIQNRIVDKLGNKDKTKASFIWLVDNDAISQDDYNVFLESKMVRNKFAHELTTTIFQGIEDQHIMLLINLCEMLKRISQWFFIEVELPIMGDELLNDVKHEDIESAGSVIFQVIMDVLYNGKSEQYQEIIARRFR
jgi:hypothetical protein